MSNESITPQDLRIMCRSGVFSGPTSGYSKGRVQANMMIVPREYAFDLLLFCQRNPKPCPLVEVLEPGRFEPVCAKGGDVRSDLPGYRIFKDGVLQQEVTDIREYWREDLVTFLIGCSFSFESALMEGGIPLRHVDQGVNVAMFNTNIACVPAGRFHGNMVVSMRPVKSKDVAKAVEISARYPQVHGAPVHIGHPEALGIPDLARPDYGDPVEILGDELPVFWACGVTPQAVVRASRIPFCISHSPGKMLVTDLFTD